MGEQRSGRAWCARGAQLNNDSGPIRVRDMQWPELRKLLQVRGGEIGTLSSRGDALAQAVEAAYRYLYDHPGDQAAGANLRSAVEDYINRDLRIAEVAELGCRLGHRLPEPEKAPGARIFINNATRKQ